MSNLVRKYRKLLIFILFIVFTISTLGIINTKAAEKIFRITSATILDKSDTVEADVISFDEDDININSTFHQLDDFITYKLVIKNTSKKKYKINNISIDNSSPYLEVSYDQIEDKEISPNESFEVDVNVVYKNEITDLTQRNSDDTFKLYLDYEDEKGVKGDTENPKTGDNIKIYIVLAAFSLSGIIILSIKRKKLKKALVIAIMFTPFIGNALTSKIVFKFNSNTKLMDKIIVTQKVGNEETEVVIPYNTNPEKPSDPNKDGYNFEGWYINEDKYNFDRPLKEDEVIEAKFSLINYSITYNLDGGTITGNKTSYNVETDTFTLVKPTKEGYNFSGWTGSNGENLQPVVTINKGTTGDKIYTAHYSEREDTKYTVHHEYEELNGSFTTEDEEGEGVTGSTIYPEVRPREGYNTPQPKPLEIAPDGSANITYTYLRRELTLTYSDTTNIDLTLSSASGPHKYGEQIKVVAKEKDGHTFSKWSDDSTDLTHTFTMTDSITIYPIYSVNSYTVTFDAENDTTNSTITRNYNTKVGELPVPEKENYVFDGWYTSDDTKITKDTIITGDITFYAHWNKSVYFLNVENTDITLTNHDTANITITNSDEIGEEYTFTSNDEDVVTVNSEGVITTTGVGTTTITIKGNTSNIEKTINVTVNAKKYTVTFDSNGGNNISSVEVEEGNSLTSIPEPTKENYIFDGWYNEDNKLTTSTKINDDITYTAKWNKSVYFLNVENTDITITNHDTANITITNSDDIGEEYTFTSNDEDVVTVNSEGVITTTGVGTTTITIKGNTSNIEKTINVTVNAKKYTVTFDSNGGNNISSVEVEEGNSLTSIPEPERDGYTFDGWFDNDSKLTTSTKINDDITYIAHWTEVENIDFVCYRATQLHSDTCSRTDSNGCVADGYIDDNSTVTFGKIPSTGAYKVGDAFDCDVNGNGEIDVDSNGNSIERFYYLRTTNDNKMVFSYYSNTVNGIADNTKTYAYTTDGKNYSLPTTLLSHLPNKTAWNNVSIDSEIQLYNENSETTAGGYDLPALDYSNYSSRMITLDDLEIACNIDVTTSSQEKTIPTGSNGCQFLFENTTYVNPNIKSGYWVATALSNSTNKMFRTVGSRHTVESKEASSSTGSGIRPVIEVPVDKVETPLESNTYTVTFNSVGGSNVPPMEVNKNSNLGTLPIEPTKSGYNFIGWYTDTSYKTEVNEDTIITEDTTFYAKWLLTNAVAEYNNEGYTSVNAAINTLTDSNTANIKLLKNTSEKITVPSGRDIQLDLNGKTISVASDMNVVANSGTLKIYNGTLTTTAAKNAAINNNNGGVLYLNDIEIHGNGSRSTIYNYGGGTVYIDKNSYLKAYNDQRASIVNLANGTIYIYGGTIESTQKEGIDNAGNLIIGLEDGISNSESPIIQGIEYGIKTTTNISFYDGIIKGKTDYINDRTKISDIEENHNITTASENIGNVSYTTAHLMLVEGKILIIFDTKGGELENASLLLDEGDNVGILPIPTKGIYSFDGWYLDEEYNTKVENNTIPESSSTYYAKWIYDSSDEVVNFRTTSDVMKVYYNKLDTWKLDRDSFQTNMVANFDNYSCKCTDNTCSTTGTVECDKPKGYDTGTNEELDVYLYNTSTNTRGKKIDYAKASNGIIYNLIPDTVYYWELKDDSNVHGYVKFTGERRIIDAGEIRNVRDLGGLAASYKDENNNTVTGHLKYGRLFRGVKIGTKSSNKLELTNLGINEEVDLRAPSEISSSNDAKLDNFKSREIKHYQIDRDNYLSNYNMTRAVIKEVMTDIVSGNNIYFHCRIGTDRTGTLAYILEGLLGVSEEERLEDYELSFFYGLINRHRYYETDPTSSVSKTEKFVYMYNFLNTNQSIYDWYMAGSTDIDADKELIKNFRNAMIEKD